MTSPTKKTLRIVNARENNLKEISLDIPHDCFTVVTGLSGSGKSSLAFSTVYAEGQRRYIETFSPYTRQFFDKVKKPDVDSIENVRPAIAIEQRTKITNSRSTVGTMTNVNDYLKVLWAAVSHPTCTTCGIELEKLSVQEILERILQIGKQKEAPLLYLSAPYALQGKKAPERIARLKELGFSRAFDESTGEIYSIEDTPLAKFKNQLSITIVLDRLRPPYELSKRLIEATELALSLSENNTILCIDPRPTRNLAQISKVTGNNKQLKAFRSYQFSTSIGCPEGNSKITPPRPNLFSFNHPLGACPSCKGFGKVLRPDPAKVVPNPNLSIKEGAIAPWSGEAGKSEKRKLYTFCEKLNISITSPWRELQEEHKNLLFNYKGKDYRGINPWFSLIERKSYKMHVRVFLARYRGQYDCPECQGSRLTPSARAYVCRGKTMPELWTLSIKELHAWVAQELEEQKKVYKKLPRELGEVFSQTLSRLASLISLGLSYLTLDRQARTLSGGETQRVNLAAALGSELVSTHFVLDEPSVGLHPQDTANLIRELKALGEKGNSLLIVEHDLDTIAAADHIIELGPKAGEEGGTVTFNDTPNKWRGITIEHKKRSRKDLSKAKKLSIKNAHARNLKNISLDLPLGALITFSGVSGSGKSTFVHEVLAKGYESYKLRTPLEGAEKISGFEHIGELAVVDQSPLSKSPRGNIGTYSGIWDSVRDLFSKTDGALTRGLSKSAFSFNVDEGRCPECEGAGFIKEDMQFLSDVYIPCAICLGKRFQTRVLEVTYKGKSIDEVLGMSVDRAKNFFTETNSIQNALSVLSQLGLGHITLGHPLSELSGGEAQRLKLVPYINQQTHTPSIIVFDEPTTGLHHNDVMNLIDLFSSLTVKGHTVICVEHNLSVIEASDYMVDLGPEGGSGGGRLIACGQPDEILKNETLLSASSTLQHLERYLKTDNVTFKSRKAGPSKPPPTAVKIRGAREHNLKNIDLDLPLNTLVALCGVSGSGKSSIAKDIIYAEGQRRYLDCLSPYARQFIKELKRPEIESIENIPPTICVYQHTFQPGRLSTVGTMSEVYNFLRLLFAKTGIQHCPDHPKEVITPLSPENIAKEVAAIKAKSVRILAPIIKQKKGSHREIFERAISEEVASVRVDGVFLTPSAVSLTGGLERHKIHSIDFVIAKFNPSGIDEALLESTIAQALSLGGGTIVVIPDGAGAKEIIFSTERTCPVCKRGFFKPDPEDLSFHSKRGRCLTCEGTGVDEEGEHCSTCDGSRLSELGRNIRIDGENIFELSRRPAQELLAKLDQKTFSKRAESLSTPILVELTSRLNSLTSLGLGSLPVTRDCATLSSGELQRLRLATAMGSPLTGVLYIFDEPSAGLHPLDNKKVIKEIQSLAARGNSVITIEHDAESILSSEYIIDIGPKGGSGGGNVVFSGSKADFLASTTSPTALAITNKSDALPPYEGDALGVISIKGARLHNLKNLSLTIPLGKLTTVAGVSGAGKSTLVRGLIAKAFAPEADKNKTFEVSGAKISSSLDIARVVEVDQSPIGANARSTPASYLGIWDEIRKLYAKTIEAESRGWKDGFFSYNAGKGKCPECKGLGVLTLEMNFLPDATIACDTCGGTRFNEDAKSVRYLGKNVAEVLAMTFEEASKHFVHHRKIFEPTNYACELGLGYLTLGQSSKSLSGGESQRLKLISELGLKKRGHSLYLLDEPTTGLHKSDILRLLRSLRVLVTQGNTVILIEHDEECVKNADYLIELGPEAGVLGGELLFAGSPKDLSKNDTPWARLIG
jgi:excinuclease ABC subunit A